MLLENKVRLWIVKFQILTIHFHAWTIQFKRWMFQFKVLIIDFHNWITESYYWTEFHYWNFITGRHSNVSLCREKKSPKIPNFGLFQKTQTNITAKLEQILPTLL